MTNSANGESGERRLLVISYHQPTDGEVGGLRWAGFTKYLARLGWKSWILTAAPPPTGPLPSGVTIEYCPPGRGLIGRYYRLRQALSSPAAPPPAPVPARGGLVGATRTEMAGLLTVWLQGQGWMLRSALRARALIARVQPHVVVSTSPPHIHHLAAWFATRGRDVRWIVDLRDPWATSLPRSAAADAAQRSRLARSLIAAVERLVIQSADQVVTTTRDLAAALTARYPRAPIRWIPNSVDKELLPPKSAHPFPGLAVAHVGSLYQGRQLGPVLRAFRAFLNRHPRAATAGSKLRQAGEIEAPQQEAIERDLLELDLAAHVDRLGRIPRTEALEILARSHLALVLAGDGDYQVPAKLYEALAIGIPTLVLAPRDSAAARAASRVGALLAEPDDVAGMTELLSQVWSEPERFASMPVHSTDHQTLAPAMSAVLSGDGHGHDAAPNVVNLA